MSPHYIIMNLKCSVICRVTFCKRIKICKLQKNCIFLRVFLHQSNKAKMSIFHGTIMDLIYYSHILSLHYIIMNLKCSVIRRLTFCKRIKVCKLERNFTFLRVFLHHRNETKIMIFHDTIMDLICYFVGGIFCRCTT